MMIQPSHLQPGLPDPNARLPINVLQDVNGPPVPKPTVENPQPTEDLTGPNTLQQLCIEQNLKFITLTPYREPTYYFGAGHCTGRIRTTHPHGPLVKLDDFTSVHNYFAEKRDAENFKSTLKQFFREHPPAERLYIHWLNIVKYLNETYNRRNTPFEGAYHVEYQVCAELLTINPAAPNDHHQQANATQSPQTLPQCHSVHQSGGTVVTCSIIEPQSRYTPQTLTQTQVLEAQRDALLENEPFIEEAHARDEDNVKDYIEELYDQLIEYLEYKRVFQPVAQYLPHTRQNNRINAAEFHALLTQTTAEQRKKSITFVSTLRPRKTYLNQYGHRTQWERKHNTSRRCNRSLNLMMF